MALEQLHLENFTVFRKLDLKFCRGINVLIGENGTGKTHLLKVLYAFYESNTLSRNAKLLFFETLSQCFCADRFDVMFNRLGEPLKITLGVNEKFFAYQAAFKDNIPKEEQLEPPLGQMEVSLQIKGKRTREEVKTAFIPAKEMLTHAGIEKDYVERHVPFDKTLVDILFKSGMSQLRELTPSARETLDCIQQIIGGRVVFEKDRYFIMHTGYKTGFQSEAEGFKKLSVLWRLIETGLLARGSLLFWDEPEANINPKYIPQLVDMLYALQESGVQIVLATHDYVLAKYLELKSRGADSLGFHSLYYNGSHLVEAESKPLFRDLEKNSIGDAYNQLLDEVFEQTIRG